jgi:hypothetical protein
VSYSVDFIRLIPRGLAIAIGLRKIAPLPDHIPNILNLKQVPPIDTGGAFRPDWRMQDPAKDPKEPYGSESSGAGSDHGWSNCTCVSAALVYAYHVRDQTGPQGGDMRHNQDDFSGGTDLYDMDTAWHRYGNQNLVIKTGSGWGAVKTAHSEGRAILIQGTGNVPGSETFDGSHACVIGPETNSAGEWLWGDPLASGWQWVPVSKIETWAKALSSSIYFAVSKLPPSEPVPVPPTPPKSETYPKAPATDYAIPVHDEELLRDAYYWAKHPEGTPPFPIGDVLELLAHPNEGWGVGKWNQTTWYLDPQAARWGTAIWAGTTSVGSVWA